MRYRSKLQSRKLRAVLFGLLPCVLGLGAARYMYWSDAVWLTTAGSLWPIILASISCAVLVKLAFSPFEDATSGVAAWLTLVWTWFYFPLWATAREAPYSAAIVDRGGRVHLVSEVTRDSAVKVWFLTDHPGTRTVHNVVGKVVAGALELEYRYAEPYVATRRDKEDLAKPLYKAASAILEEEAAKPRTAKIRLLEKREVQSRVLERICRAAVADEASCPIKMGLSPQREATVLGATWSPYYSEREAIEEKHLPTLVQLLTQPDSPLVHRDEVFALLLETATDVAPLSQVAQQSHWLDDGEFDTLIRRILAAPGCGNEAVAVLSKSNRLTAEQRLALRARALDDASIATLLAHAAPLRISDADIAHFAARMPPAFMADPGVAVRALEVFGERLPGDVQREAVAAIVRARPSYALSALRYVNFSAELRRDLLSKVLADASQEDFSSAGLSKEKLQATMTPAELRAVIAMAVKRSEASNQWLDFALGSLPIRAMTAEEQRSLLTGLLFRSPKAALEFVSENHRYLEPAEVNDVTRDYTRTITADLCLHLSHRNRNRKSEYFSEAQLKIFRDCAGSK
jgi:hypothetical protein